MHKLSGRGLHLLEGARAPFAYRCLRISKASPGKKRLERSIPAPGAGLFGPPLRPAQDPSPPPGGRRVCEVGCDKLAELLAVHGPWSRKGGSLGIGIAREDAVHLPRDLGAARGWPPDTPSKIPAGGAAAANRDRAARSEKTEMMVRILEGAAGLFWQKQYDQAAYRRRLKIASGSSPAAQLVKRDSLIFILDQIFILGIDVLCFAVVVFFYDFCGFHSPPPLLFSSHSYILLSIIRLARSHKCIGDVYRFVRFVDEIL